MLPFKFIHAADLHLESPYKGVSRMSEGLGVALVKNGIQAYDNLIQTAIEEKIDFLLISGDSFDSESGSLSAQYRFVKGLEKLKDALIPVYIICGNHDPLNSWSKHLKLPDNVYLFEADEVQQKTVFKEDEAIADIYGVSFANKVEYRRRVKEFQKNSPSLFAIGMLHGNLEGSTAHSNYCPFNLDELRASNMDYWALGHIHKREVISAEHPLAVYPGNLQGRHFNETGEKGCSLLTISNGRIQKHRFISLSNVIYAYVELETTEISDLAAFTEAVDRLKTEELSEEKSYLLRIRLTGNSGMHAIFAKHNEMSALADNLNEQNHYHSRFVFIDRFINETQAQIDLEKRKQSSDFIADLLHRFDELENNSEKIEQLIEDAMTEINTSKVGRALKHTDFEKEVTKDFKSLLSAAKWQLMDGLIKKDEEE